MNPRVPIWWENNITLVNNPAFVSVAQNKYESLVLMDAEGVRIPKFTTLKKSAEKWIIREIVAVAMTLLRGCGGRGIQLIDNVDDLPYFALYTRYVKKSDEYRVHIFMGTIIFLQKKMLRNGSEGNNFQIRNYANGWIFGSKNIAIPPPSLACC